MADECVSGHLGRDRPGRRSPPACTGRPRAPSTPLIGVDPVGGDGELEGLVVQSRSGRRRRRRTGTWPRRTGSRPQVGADGDGVARAGVAEGQDPAAHLGVDPRTRRAPWSRCRATASSPTSGGSRSRGRRRRCPVRCPTRGRCRWRSAPGAGPRPPARPCWCTRSCQERLGHRVLGLLDLEHQRVALVAAHEQGHPAAGADRADADHLAGQVGELVRVEQVPPVAGQGDPVLGRGRRAGLVGIRLGVGVEQVVGRASAAAGRTGTGACRRPRSVSRARAFRWSFERALRHPLLEGLDHLPVAASVPHAGQRWLGVEPLVPDVEVAHLAELADGLPVAVGRHGPPACDRSTSSKPRLRAATSMLAARRLRSHSNGPGSVSSKSLTSKIMSRSGRGEAAEVDQVGVPAELDVEVRSGPRGPGRRP